MKITICDACGKKMQAGYSLTVKQTSFMENACACIEPVTNYDLCVDCCASITVKLNKERETQ